MRDRFGIKPLYLWRTDRGWPSRRKSRRSSPTRLQGRVNDAALREYFTFQNLFRPHTLFADVEHLPPASIMTSIATATATNVLGLSISPER